MARKKGFSPISLTQVMTFVGLILAGYFIFSFAKVALVGYQLRNIKADLQDGVATLEEEVAGLEAKAAYVESDAYIEEYAREDLGMSRPGDHVIVPEYQPDGETQIQQPTEPVEPAELEPKQPWQAWWELFFEH